MASRNNLEWRVGQLERSYDDLDKKIETILTNHLPHINENLISMQTRINVLTAVNIGALIVAIVIEKIWK